MTGKICRFVTISFLVLYVAALTLLAVGTFGLFGAGRDPLSGIFLMPLGVPWNLLLTNAPESWLPWIGIAAPAVNLVLIFAICRMRRRRVG